MFEDNISRIWQKFNAERTRALSDRFHGFYRALVVETNDPLQMHRVRVKCPELHDFDLKPEQCPWAERAPWFGGKNAGTWYHPVIGDVVWVQFEKNHPYNILWFGFAMGTRRKRYPLEGLYVEPPLALKEDETADERPDDALVEYLPKDRRPMSLGTRDRYGSFDMVSSVGFFPVEHADRAAPTGTDAVSMKQFQKGKSPLVNDPDRKYMVRTSKYGTYAIHSDVGYWWSKAGEGGSGGDGDLGEFEGDFDKDRPFEVKRYKYLTRLFNEDVPVSEDGDQRRYEIRTRAGHKFEMRDVGWAQKGGAMSGCDSVGGRSRDGEYGEPRVLSKWDNTDERWVKLRTKGGHLIQAMDMGFHPEEDKFYKRLLIDELGAGPDGEIDSDWTGRDARQIRIVTRWGSKFVLDDRGTDPRNADTEEAPRGNGWMLKSVRSWESEPSERESSRGFAIEANDKDELNTTRWYSPKSKVIELNDRFDYVMMCTDLKGDLCRNWRGLAENEFALKAAMVEDPEKDTYHLKLDKFNGYIRLKTAAGGDNGRRPEPKPFEAAEIGLNQGVEMRDGRFGSDGPWTELVDIDHRGMWFSRNEKMGVWRGAEGSEQYICIHDGNGSIVIKTVAGGPVQIFSSKRVEVIGEDVAVKASSRISLNAGTSVDMRGGGGRMKLTSGALFLNVPTVPGGSDVIDPEEVKQGKREPEDRAESLEEIKEIEEKIVTSCDIGANQ